MTAVAAAAKPIEALLAVLVAPVPVADCVVHVLHVRGFNLTTNIANVKL